MSLFQPHLLEQYPISADFFHGFARRAANEVGFMEAGLVAHRAPVRDFFNGSAPERVSRFLNRMHG